MTSEKVIEQARRDLLKAGINPSIQRLKIYTLLCRANSHPTADAIHCQLIKEIPTLSKTTIYNTLGLFHRKGLVQGITIDENEVRYDANTTPHAHFKCERCGCILDVPIDFSHLCDCLSCRHRIREHHIYLKGLCAECAEQRSMLS